MSPLITVLLYGSLSLLSFLISITPLVYYVPQIIALCLIVLFFNHKPARHGGSYIPFFLVFLISLLVFATHGLASPVFFLTYFLLFILAFQNPPSVTLAFSLILILLLSQSLDSPLSLLPLFSLACITPLVWFTGRQFLAKIKTEAALTRDETDLFLWISLRFKSGISTIIDLSSQLLSQPRLSPTQSHQINTIRKTAKTLLDSSHQLAATIQKESPDET